MLLYFSISENEMINNNHHFCKECGKRCESAWVNLCNMHIGEKSVSDKKIFHIPCPRCSNKKSKYMTSYKIMRSKQKARRFECLYCKMMFTERTEDFGRKIVPKWKMEKVMEYYRIRKPSINIHDHLKKTTFSSREIASLFNVSKSFVQKTVRGTG